MAGIVEAGHRQPALAGEAVERLGLRPAHVGLVAAEPEQTRRLAGPLEDGDVAGVGAATDAIVRACGSLIKLHSG